MESPFRAATVVTVRYQCQSSAIDLEHPGLAAVVLIPEPDLIGNLQMPSAPTKERRNTDSTGTSSSNHPQQNNCSADGTGAAVGIGANLAAEPPADDPIAVSGTGVVLLDPHLPPSGARDAGAAANDRFEAQWKAAASSTARGLVLTPASWIYPVLAPAERGEGFSRRVKPGT